MKKFTVNTKIGPELENVDCRVTQIVLVRVHDEDEAVDARLESRLRERVQGMRGEIDIGAPPHLKGEIAVINISGSAK